MRVQNIVYATVLAVAALFAGEPTLIVFLLALIYFTLEDIHEGKR